jgi:DNA-directed RNA polymerase specialized sigma54-like protein
VEKIVTNNMDELEKKKYSSLAQQYNLPLQDIMAAIKLLRGLNPNRAEIFRVTPPTILSPTYT